MASGDAMLTCVALKQPGWRRIQSAGRGCMNVDVTTRFFCEFHRTSEWCEEIRGYIRLFIVIRCYPYHYFFFSKCGENIEVETMGRGRSCWKCCWEETLNMQSSASAREVPWPTLPFEYIITLCYMIIQWCKWRLYITLPTYIAGEIIFTCQFQQFESIWIVVQRI